VANFAGVSRSIATPRVQASGSPSAGPAHVSPYRPSPTRFARLGERRPTGSRAAGGYGSAMMIKFGRWPMNRWVALAGRISSAGILRASRRQETQVMDGVRTSILRSHRLVGGGFAFLFLATDESMGGIEHLRSEQ